MPTQHAHAHVHVHNYRHVHMLNSQSRVYPIRAHHGLWTRDSHELTVCVADGPPGNGIL